MRSLLLVLALALAAPAFAKKPVKVKAHVTKDGKYVPAHVRTAPNKTKTDNYSTEGNRNPYTGRKGSKK